jgi:hypothetical protein
MWGTTARIIRTTPKKSGRGDTEAGVVHEQVDAALQPHHILDGSFH